MLHRSSLPVFDNVATMIADLGTHHLSLPLTTPLSHLSSPHHPTTTPPPPPHSSPPYASSPPPPGYLMFLVRSTEVWGVESKVSGQFNMERYEQCKDCFVKLEKYLYTDSDVIASHDR